MVRSGMLVVLFASAFAAQAGAATPYDGTYKGASVLKSAKGGRCEPQIAFTLPITDGKFNWRLPGGGGVEEVTLKPDGSFAAQNGKRFLSGRVSGGKITGESVGEYCVYGWDLAR